MSCEATKYKELFLAAKKYIDKTPCDPDITPEQQEAWFQYLDLLEEHNER